MIFELPNFLNFIVNAKYLFKIILIDYFFWKCLFFFILLFDHFCNEDILLFTWPFCHLSFLLSDFNGLSLLIFFNKMLILAEKLIIPRLFVQNIGGFQGSMSIFLSIVLDSLSLLRLPIIIGAACLIDKL